MNPNELDYSYLTSFDRLSIIWDNCQKQKARDAITKADRAKKTLTRKEKLNKYAQMGKVIRYRELTFTFIDGAGYIMYPDGTGVWGTTISEFAAEIERIYDVTLKWAHE